MNKERLKEIITQLKDITAELESEVYSDLEAYKTYGGSTLTLMIQAIMMNSVIEIQLAVVKKMRECYPSIRAAYFIKTRPIIL